MNFEAVNLDLKVLSKLRPRSTVVDITSERLPAITTSVMIIIAGASLSEQHTDLTNLSLHKAGFVTHK